MDIVVWLRSLGLEEYEAAFRENATSEACYAELFVPVSMRSILPADRSREIDAQSAITI
jgi:hypothetical protein